MPNQDNLTADTNDAAYRIVPILNNRLKEAATTAGWPAYIVDAIYVNYDGATLYVDVPPSFEGDVDDLEYGSPYGLPNAVIGPFISRSEDVIKEVLMDKTVEEVTDLLMEVFIG
jgi:hypothetical protein